MIDLSTITAASDAWQTDDGKITLLRGDCLEILPQLPKVDCVLTDPPYGIDYGKLMKGKGDGAGGLDKNRWKDYGQFDWDQTRPSAAAFQCILNASSTQIIWGGNYFADMLPPKMGWLVWDKMQREFSLADFELAWTSRNVAGRALSYSRPEALRDGRHHPTQKPIALMEWCLGFVPDARTILDPFMGSGTTGVACIRLGRSFIGIELEPTYFEITKERIRKELERTALLEKPAKLVQRTIA